MLLEHCTLLIIEQVYLCDTCSCDCEGQGLCPFQKKKFGPFFRTFPGLRLIFSRTLKLTSTISPLPAIHFIFFYLSLTDFHHHSRTSSLFPGFSSPGKCNNKIPELFRFSRTPTNPARIMRWFSLASAVVDIYLIYI